MGYYYVALRNKIYHQYNRFYLLFAFALSWCIPVLPITLSVPKETVSTPVFQAIQYISDTAEPFETTAVVEVTKPILTFNNILLCCYGIVCMIMMIIFIRVLYFLFRLTKKYKAQTFNTCKIYLTQESNTPFSFFKHIFWNTTVDVESAIGKQILQHELTHINEKHSWDKVYVQLNLFVGWFNPFFWLMKKELEMIHEFIADKKSVPNANTELFAQMLLNTAFAGKNISLTNPFFFSPIKRRLTMLTKKSNPKFSYVQRIIALPVLTVLVIVFSLKAQGISVKQVINNNLPGTFTIKTNSTETNAAESPATTNINTLFLLKKKYKVVIDAGHGGTDKGATSADGKTFEKDIALNFAKTITELNANDNIEIVLTREDDVFMNPKEKAEFAKKQNADLFVSLHCNTTKNTEEKGIEIYTVSKEKNNSYKEKSDALATYINTYIASSGFTTLGIKQREVGIWVLQATNCPSVLIEAGYITNEEDCRMMKDKDKRKAFCNQVLNGIQNYLYNVDNDITVDFKDANTLKTLNKNIDLLKENENEHSANSNHRDTFLTPEQFKEKHKMQTSSSGVTNEEMNEYKNLVEKSRTGSSDIPTKFDTKKLTKEEKEKMFVIYNKMDEQQKESVEIKVHKNSDTYVQQSPTQKQINEWLTNEHFRIAIDNKTVNKETIQNIKATDFAVYGVLETFINGLNPSENKYNVQLITNEFYYRNKGNKIHLYWNNFSPKISDNKLANEATLEEVKWMEAFSRKYNPHTPSTPTTKNGITQEERKKAEQIFDKMSAEQKLESNVVFEDPRPVADLNKENGLSKYISMKVGVRKRYY